MTEALKREAKTPTFTEERTYLRPSELAVVRLRSLGVTLDGISDQLGIARKTVEQHMREAKEVWRCTDIPHLTAEYVRRVEVAPLRRDYPQSSR